MERLLLVFGGQSSEHQISRMSASSIYKQLNKDKYSITLVGIDQDGHWYQIDSSVNDFTVNGWLKNSQRIDDIYGLITQHDVAFPILHGAYGEDGTIQGLFELARIPYVGCKVLASSVAMDKIYTKMILERAKIPQVKSLYIKKRNDGTFVNLTTSFEENKDYVGVIEKKIGYPCFIKPSNSGSSVGVNKATNREELIQYIEYAAKFDCKIVVEENIDCIELECAALGNDDVCISSIGQILPAGDFYTFESKYQDENSKTMIPALVDVAIQEEIRELAKRAFKAIDGKGLARIDFFLDKDSNSIYLNEINTMPGFTSISMYPQLWMHEGMEYQDILDKLIALAKE